MGENPDPSSPPSADHLLPKSENPRRPPTSMTIPRGGSAGGEEETPSQLPPWPFEPWPETIVEETTSQLPPWPFSPGPETVVEETSSQLPSRPFSPCPETVVEETPSQLQSQPFVPWLETVVEETPGVWDSEGSPVESGKKEDDGEALSSMRYEEDGSQVDDENLIEIARMQGWQGPYNITFLRILKIIIPYYFIIPTVRSILLISKACDEFCLLNFLYLLEFLMLVGILMLVGDYHSCWLVDYPHCENYACWRS